MARTSGAASLAALTALVLGACGGEPGSGAGAGTEAPLEVVASFYPLQFVAERVGGDRVRVTNLTPTGAEPHDLELRPKDVGRVEDADLVVYLGGFSPAVDEAVDRTGKGNALDVGALARLDLRSADGDHRLDPHFWLDPTRLAGVVDGVAERLGELDTAGRADYTAAAASLKAELAELDRELAGGLASCASDDLVTTHGAFAYLAERYGLHQTAITGLAPDSEPTPRRLADVAAFVGEHGVRTIYFETLASPAVARAVARETGAATAVLDPLEGLREGTSDDYVSIMRQNLATLRAGQPCP